MPRPGRHNRADMRRDGWGRRGEGMDQGYMDITHPSTLDSQRSSFGSRASLRGAVSGRVSSTTTSGTVVDGSLMTSPRVRSALELLASPRRLPLPLPPWRLLLPLPLPLPVRLPLPLPLPLPLELLVLLSLPLPLLVALAPWSAGAAAAEEAPSALAPGTAEISLRYAMRGGVGAGRIQ